MDYAAFSPHAISPRPCRHCSHFGIERSGGGGVWCLLAKHVHCLPETGCAYWVREPGTDDDIGDSPL